MNLPKTISPLLRRGIVFLGLFVVISGLIGPRIISGDILLRDGFVVYGSLGKVLIFGLIAFVLLVRHNKKKLLLHSWQPTLLLWTVAALIALIAAWFAIDNLLAGQRSAVNLILAHAGLWLGIAGVALSCIGPKNMTLLWHTYKREIAKALALAVGFYLFLLVVYALWQPLASVVLFCVEALLAASGLVAVIVPPHTLVLDKFGITIAEYCSGIESIALFTGLYAIVGLLDWQRLNKQRYLIVFPIALMLLFGLNIVRVYGLIVAGYHINPQIAFSLFHTYAGMVFFILYSAAFWAIAYKHLLSKKARA